MSKLIHMKTIDGIPIYADPFMDREGFMVMYEGLWTPPWMMDVPFDPIKAMGIEDIEDIQKKKKKRKLSDVKGIICNCPEEDIDKIIQALYKEFKP